MERLRFSNDIKAVYATGMKVYHPYLRIMALSNPTVTRMTVVVSKQVSKRAVDRNRLKRRLRAHMAKLLPQLKRTVDMVITVQPKGLTATALELRTVLEANLVKLKLL